MKRYMQLLTRGAPYMGLKHHLFLMLAITSAAENCFSNISLSLHAATQKTKQQSKQIKVMIVHINYPNFSTLVYLVFKFLVNQQLKKLK